MATGRFLAPLNGATLQQQIQKPYVDDIWDPLFNRDVQNYYRNTYGALGAVPMAYMDMWDNALTGQKGILGPGMGILGTFGRSMDKADDVILGTLTEGVNLIGRGLKGSNDTPINPIRNIFVNDYNYEGTGLLAAMGNAMSRLSGQGDTKLTEEDFNTLGDRVAGTVINLATDPGWGGSRLARLNPDTPVGQIGQFLSKYDDVVSRAASDIVLPGSRTILDALNVQDRLKVLVDGSSPEPYTETYMSGQPKDPSKVFFDPKDTTNTDSNLDAYSDLSNELVQTFNASPVNNPEIYYNAQAINEAIAQKKFAAAGIDAEIQGIPDSTLAEYSKYVEDYDAEIKALNKYNKDLEAYEKLDEVAKSKSTKPKAPEIKYVNKSKDKLQLKEFYKQSEEQYTKDIESKKAELYNAYNGTVIDNEFVETHPEYHHPKVDEARQIQHDKWIKLQDSSYSEYLKKAKTEQTQALRKLQFKDKNVTIDDPRLVKYKPLSKEEYLKQHPVEKPKLNLKGFFKENIPTTESKAELVNKDFEKLDKLAATEGRSAFKTNLVSGVNINMTVKDLEDAVDLYKQNQSNYAGQDFSTIKKANSALQEIKNTLINLQDKAYDDYLKNTSTDIKLSKKEFLKKNPIELPPHLVYNTVQKYGLFDTAMKSHLGRYTETYKSDMPYRFVPSKYAYGNYNQAMDIITTTFKHDIVDKYPELFKKGFEKEKTGDIVKTIKEALRQHLKTIPEEHYGVTITDEDIERFLNSKNIYNFFDTQHFYKNRTGKLKAGSNTNVLKVLDSLESTDETQGVKEIFNFKNAGDDNAYSAIHGVSLGDEISNNIDDIYNSGAHVDGGLDIDSISGLDNSKVGLIPDILRLTDDENALRDPFLRDLRKWALDMETSALAYKDVDQDALISKTSNLGYSLDAVLNPDLLGKTTYIQKGETKYIPVTQTVTGYNKLLNTMGYHTPILKKDIKILADDLTPVVKESPIELKTKKSKESKYKSHRKEIIYNKQVDVLKHIVDGVSYEKTTESILRDNWMDIVNKANAEGVANKTGPKYPTSKKFLYDDNGTRKYYIESEAPKTAKKIKDEFTGKDAYIYDRNISPKLTPELYKEIKHTSDTVQYVSFNSDILKDYLDYNINAKELTKKSKKIPADLKNLALTKEESTILRHFSFRNNDGKFMPLVDKYGNFNGNIKKLPTFNLNGKQVVPKSIKLYITPGHEFEVQELLTGFVKEDNNYWINNDKVLTYFRKYDKSRDLTANNIKYTDTIEGKVKTEAKLIKDFKQKTLDLLEEKYNEEYLSTAQKNLEEDPRVKDFVKNTKNLNSKQFAKLVSDSKNSLLKFKIENETSKAFDSFIDDWDLRKQYEEAIANGTEREFLLKHVRNLGTPDQQRSLIIIENAFRKSVQSSHRDNDAGIMRVKHIEALSNRAKILDSEISAEDRAKVLKAYELVNNVDGTWIKGSDTFKNLNAAEGAQVLRTADAKHASEVYASMYRNANAVNTQVGANVLRVFNTTEKLNSGKTIHTVGYSWVTNNTNIKNQVTKLLRKGIELEDIQVEKPFNKLPKSTQEAALKLKSKYPKMWTFLDDLNEANNNIMNQLGLSDETRQGVFKHTMSESSTAQKTFGEIRSNARLSSEKLGQINEALDETISTRGLLGTKVGQRTYYGDLDLYPGGFSNELSNITRATFTKGMLDNTKVQTFYDLFFTDDLKVGTHFKDANELRETLTAGKGNFHNLELVTVKFDSTGRITGLKRYDKFKYSSYTQAMDDKNCILVPKNIIAPIEYAITKDKRMSNPVFRMVNKYFTIPFKFATLCNPGFWIGNMEDAYFKQAELMCQKYGTTMEAETEKFTYSVARVFELNNQVQDIFDKYRQFLQTDAAKHNPKFAQSTKVAKALDPEIVMGTPKYFKEWQTFIDSNELTAEETSKARLYNYLNNYQSFSVNKSNYRDMGDLYDASTKNPYKKPNNFVERVMYGDPSKEGFTSQGLFLNNMASDFTLDASGKTETVVRAACVLNDLEHNGYSTEDIEKIIGNPDAKELRQKLHLATSEAMNTMYAANFNYDAASNFMNKAAYILPFPTFYLKNLSYWFDIAMNNPEEIDEILSVHEGLWASKDIENDEFAAEAKGRGAIPIGTGNKHLTGIVKQSPYNSMFGAFNAVNNFKEDFAYRTNPLMRPVARHLQKDEDVKYRPYSMDPYEKNIKQGDPKFSNLAYMFHQLNPYERTVNTFLRTPKKISTNSWQLSDFAPSVFQPDFSKKSNKK